MTQIEDVKLITGETNDDLIGVYLGRASDAILNRMYQFNFEDRPESVPDRYLSLQTQIAVYLINKMGGEGETRHSENGITREFENADIPESMLKFITPVVKVV